MKCIRCEVPLAVDPDFPPLDEHGAYSICESCFEAYMNERGYEGWPLFAPGALEPDGVLAGVPGASEDAP